MTPITQNTQYYLSRLAELSLLLHDIGKGTTAFQELLRRWVRERYRHEAVSVMMLSGIPAANSDAKWFELLAQAMASPCLPDLLEKGLATELAAHQENPGTNMPGSGGSGTPLRQMLFWLILSHHRLPHGLSNSVTFEMSGKNYRRESGSDAIALYHEGAPWHAKAWRERVARAARAVAVAADSIDADALQDIVRLFIRPLVQTADHWISAKRFPAKRDLSAAYANTVDTPSGPCVAQRLTPHLLGAAAQTGWIAEEFASLRQSFSGLPASKLPNAITRRASDNQFAWQDEASDALKALPHEVSRGWFFGQIIAGTGAGKTIGALKMAASLPGDLRVVYASPLRSLTLQAGTEFGKLGFTTEQLATIIGDPLVKSMYESASASNPEDSRFDIEVAGGSAVGPERVLDMFNDAERRMISTPVLSATLDTVMRLADTRRGGYLAHFFRVASSDLIIDEVDMYGPVDLIAIGRLIEAAGFWKSRIFLSSATLPPPVAEAFYRAYLCGAKTRMVLDEAPGPIVAGWFSNEVGPSVMEMESSDVSAQGFIEAHRAFATQAAAAASRQTKRRVLDYLYLTPGSGKTTDASRLDALIRGVARLHEVNAVPTPEGKRFSFGCVQVVNVKWCQKLAMALATKAAAGDSEFDFRVICLHGRLPLGVRDHIDSALNSMLRRGGPMGDLAPLSRPEVARFVAGSNRQDVVVILVSTMETTGRDHDFDWGVIESRQDRDIIQFAGRIRRHRTSIDAIGNLMVFDIPFAATGEWKASFKEKVPQAYRFFGVGDTLGKGLNVPEFRRAGGVGAYGDLPRYSEMLPVTYREALPFIHAGRALRDEAPVETMRGAMTTTRAAEVQRLRLALTEGSKETPRSLAEWISAKSKYARLLSNHREDYRFRASWQSNIYWRDEQGAWYFELSERKAGGRDSTVSPRDFPAGMEPGFLFSIDEEELIRDVQRRTHFYGRFSRIRLTAMGWRLPAVMDGSLRYHPQIGLVQD